MGHNGRVTELGSRSPEPALSDTLGGGPRPEQLARVGFAVAWHLLWGVLLLPCAIVAAWFAGGQQGSQDLVDGLATSFLVPVLYLAAALPFNLIVAADCALLLDRLEPIERAVGTAAIFGLAWLVVIAVLPLGDRPATSGLDAVSALGAAAGAAYGLVLGLATGPTAHDLAADDLAANGPA